MTHTRTQLAVLLSLTVLATAVTGSPSTSNNNANKLKQQSGIIVTPQVIHRDYRYVNKSIHDLVSSVDSSAGGIDITTLDGYAYRLAPVNDTIWVMMMSKNYIKVMDLDGNVFNTIYCLNPRSALQVGSNEVLLATLNGLYVATANGTIQYSLDSGAFTDVINMSGIVGAIGISRRNVRLHTYTYQNNEWQPNSNPLKLFKINSHQYRRVTAVCHGGHVYVSCFRKHSVYKFTLSGELIATLGKHGTGPESGLINAPYITSIDKQGHLLICDTNNHRLQVLNPKGHWHAFPLQRVVFPFDVIYIRNHLYILWRSGTQRKITKYPVSN